MSDKFYEAGKISLERLNDLLSDDPYSGDRDRPYNGQPWTDQGKRGQTLVEGLTMRDVGDCIRRVQLEMPDADHDRTAFIQNTMVEVEKAMGIFPNIDESAPMSIPTFEIDDTAKPD